MKIPHPKRIDDLFFGPKRVRVEHIADAACRARIWHDVTFPLRNPEWADVFVGEEEHFIAIDAPPFENRIIISAWRAYAVNKNKVLCSLQQHVVLVSDEEGLEWAIVADTDDYPRRYYDKEKK